MERQIDPDDVLAERLLETETEAAKVLRSLDDEKSATRIAGWQVAPSRILAADALCRCCEALRDARWAVMEHDADLEPTPERGFSTAEELVKHLKLGGGPKLRIVVEPDDHGYYAHCPQLPGVHAAGDSDEEAVRNARDAVHAYVVSALLHEGAFEVERR